jgi:hypothetical protein
VVVSFVVVIAFTKRLRHFEKAFDAYQNILCRWLAEVVAQVVALSMFF